MIETNIPSFNIPLLLKYDKPGPRYTSYPTVPNFSKKFTIDDYKKALAKSNDLENPKNISLYFHIPFCSAGCWFCGCNVFHTKNKELADDYIKFLEIEIKSVKDLISNKRKVEQMHWGGGTPSFLKNEQIERLYKIISDNFSFTKDAEIGIEIDPRSANKESIFLMRKLGFNRISMGVQDFSEKVQKAIHRIQPFELTKEIIDLCKEAGFESINIDLIYGLPYQNSIDFHQTLSRVIELNPNRIAFFNFAYLPEKIKIQRAIKEETLPKKEEKLKIFEMAIKGLTEAGYIFIGMDHFAKPEDELYKALQNRTLYRNFQGYNTHSNCDLIAFGASSISQVSNSYSQNEKELISYQEKIKNFGFATSIGIWLSEEDILRRDLITRLMCHFIIVKKEFEEKYKIDFDEHFKEELKDLKIFEEDGLLEIKKEKIEVKPMGRLVIRNICMVFDEYLKKGEAKIFSRTI